jgi:hypothetical protein
MSRATSADILPRLELSASISRALETGPTSARTWAKDVVPQRQLEEVWVGTMSRQVQQIALLAVNGQRQAMDAGVVIVGAKTGSS